MRYFSVQAPKKKTESIMALYVLDIGTLFLPNYEGGEKTFRIGKAVKKNFGHERLYGAIRTTMQAYDIQPFEG